jgi:hypothetical protein
MYTPNVSPPPEQTVHIAAVSEMSHAYEDVIGQFDKDGMKQQDFLSFSQGLLDIVKSNTNQYEGLNSYQKKMNGEIQELKSQLAAVQQANHYISQRCGANEELCSLLDEEQKRLHLALENLQKISQSQQSAVSETPQRNNSKVSLLKKKFSREALAPVLPRNRDTLEELNAVKKLNVLGNPENDTGQDSLPSTKIEFLQQQILKIITEISELDKKAKMCEDRSKDLDINRLIEERLKNNFQDVLDLFETYKCENNKNNLAEKKEIASLERTVFLQWIGGGIITFLLWLQIQKR